MGLPVDERERRVGTGMEGYEWGKGVMIRSTLSPIAVFLLAHPPYLPYVDVLPF